MNSVTTPKKTFTIVTDGQPWQNIEAVTLTGSNQPVTSHELYELARSLTFHAKEVAAQEASGGVQVGRLYFWRHKRGVSYATPVTIQDGKVYVMYCDRSGNPKMDTNSLRNAVMTHFWEPQSLRELKVQPEKIDFTGVRDAFTHYLQHECKVTLILASSECVLDESFMHFPAGTLVAVVKEWINTLAKSV